LLRVLRYVERNALRAGLVERAELWPWGSLASPDDERAGFLCEAPVSRPPNWRAFVNEGERGDELRDIRRSVKMGTPFGEPDWVTKTARNLGLESTLRSSGRPRRRREA